jgi:hypothetical protein
MRTLFIDKVFTTLRRKLSVYMDTSICYLAKSKHECCVRYV